jgi:predicted ArsR family transcriptional regulator
MPAKSRRGPHTIREARQLAALRAPLAFQVAAAMEEAVSCTVTELSARLGRNAESLYYHVHKLVRAGLAVTQGTRAAGRRAETVYALAGSEIRVDPNERSPAFLRALDGVYRAALRFAERDLSRALKFEYGTRPGPRSATALRQRTVRLDGRAQGKLREMLEELDRFLAEHNDPSGPESYTVTTVLSAGSRLAQARGQKPPRRRRRG